MSFKTLIRTIVVRTNTIPPFTRLNRIPYSLAIRNVKRRAAACSGVRSLYLRHGLTRTDWEPGLSDIDFSVVLSGDLSQEQEFESAREFMASYRALKRWFPMLGEVEILSEECCSAWSRFSIRGSEVGEWKLLHGTDTVKPAFVKNETSMVKNRLDHACWIYQRHILGRFYASNQRAWIEKKELLRLARKLLRYARVESVPDQPAPLSLTDSASAISLHLLGILDTQAQESPQRSAPGPVAPGPFALVPAALGSLPHLQKEAARPEYHADKFSGLQAYDPIILSVILSFSTAFVVLKDGIPLNTLKADLEEIRTICRANGIEPIITTRAVFRYYLQSFRPQVLLQLRQYRHVLFGTDLLMEIAEPSAQNLADELLNQSLNVMLAPARHAVAHTGSLPNKEWVSDAQRAAMLLLYLDTGIIGSHHHSMQACLERYPELWKEIKELSESRDASENDARAVHTLLRRCALSANEKISRLNTARPPTAPFVSVVVPVFNGHDTIAACLDSLLALNFPRERFEIIVVNNASTDKTSDVLSAYRDKVTLLMEPTRGAAAARNRGIREAAGEIIAFTDADCTVNGDWLRHVIEPLKDRSVGIVGGRILSVRPCNAIEKFGETIHDHQKAIEVFKPPYVITMNWSSPRQVLMDAGLFDESYLRCQDVDLSQRILRRDHRIVYQHDAIIYHRNERTFAGLFREGFQHGKWGVKHNKHQHAINTLTGHRHINIHSYRKIGASLLGAVVSEQRQNAFCQALFDIGKKCGKIAGSIRFGYIDL